MIQNLMASLTITMTMAIFVHKMFNLKVFREKDRDMDKDIERD